MRAHVAAAAIIALAVSSPLGAQVPQRVSGIVRDSLGHPIAEAHVMTATTRALTDSVGHFTLTLGRTDSTTITVRRLGFESVSFTLATDTVARNDLDIELSAIPRLLAEVDVTADRRARVPTIEGFEQRRRDKGGAGYFLGREQLAAREMQPLSNVLRDARGVKIMRGANGRGVLRFARWSGKGNCAPAMFLDGSQVAQLEVDDVMTRDVEALEMYANASSAPFEFATREFSCGVVAIWTRRPILKSR